MGLVKPAFAQFPNEKKLSVNFSFKPIALIDIEPGTNNCVQFTIAANTESGGEFTVKNVSTEKLWLNYTSVITSEQRDIKARIESGNLPEGVKLVLTATSYQGGGEGEMGQSTGQISLSAQDKVIISGVGNCYTGDGMNNGHALDFDLVVDDISQLAAVNESIFTIIYTISE